jgi:hypothetical protein
MIENKKQDLTPKIMTKGKKQDLIPKTILGIDFFD